MCGEVTAVSRAYRVTQCMKKAKIMAIKFMAWSIMQVNNDTDENKIFKGQPSQIIMWSYVHILVVKLPNLFVQS